jgi:hypothetical protein
LSFERAMASSMSRSSITTFVRIQYTSLCA